MSFGDPFAFHMAFSPTVVLTLTQPVSPDFWISEWVDPLRRVVCLATGAQEDITYLALDPTENAGTTKERPGLCQVYGFGLTQDPYSSSSEAIRERTTAFTSANDGVSLLRLLRTWQALAVQHHPLLETYGAFIGGTPQHLRLRYLLLLQALEGLHGFEHRSEYKKREQQHKTRRQTVPAKTTKRITDADFKFLSKYLMRKPHASLDTALHDCISTLPIDLSTALQDTPLVKRSLNDSRKPGSTVGALRLVRNDLAHGERGYDLVELKEVVDLLERVARAHLLRVLGCSETVQERALGVDLYG